MNAELRALLDRFGAMETHVLLLRYRAGGLLPEAEAALIEVLSDRGYAGEVLEQKVAALDVAPQAPAPASASLRGKRPHPELRKFNLALWLLVAPVFVFFLLLAIPILGNYIVIGGASALGCQTGENVIHPCHFLYWDIGDMVNGYMVDAFLAGAANPLISCLAFAAFVRSLPGAAWLSAVIGVFAAREVKRYRLQQQGRRAVFGQGESVEGG